jgi:hypothetical protein
MQIIGGNTAEEEALSIIRNRLETSRLILLVTKRFDEF